MCMPICQKIGSGAEMYGQLILITVLFRVFLFADTLADAW